MERTLKNKRLSPPRVIAMGFLALILTGALLLMLPFSSRDRVITPFGTALFTATSATCVTGLVRVDTYQYWSLFGKFVILALIQVGGLGFMTIATMFSFLLRKKINLSGRGLMQESVNTTQIGGVVRLTKHVLYGTVIFEGIGAIILSLRFIPRFGPLRGIGFGIFHSISAFCNAGFDLMGCIAPYSSFCDYSADPVVNIVLMLLIVIGGIGFFVWEDLYRSRLNTKKWSLHTKLVLTVTGILIFGGALLFFLFERTKLFSGMGAGETVLVSLFSSVTARTAGFNTVDTAALSHGSKLLTMILMFIGGSPGSTAGGIKTTTIAVLFLTLRAEAKHRKSTVVFNRKIDDAAMRRAVFVCAAMMTLVLAASLIICLIQPFALEDVLFEAFSAAGTVGMSTGITRQLSEISTYVIAFLIYCGRVGSLSVILLLRQPEKSTDLDYLTEKISIG